MRDSRGHQFLEGSGYMLILVRKFQIERWDVYVGMSDVYEEKQHLTLNDQITLIKRVQGMKKFVRHGWTQQLNRIYVCV